MVHKRPRTHYGYLNPIIEPAPTKPFSAGPPWVFESPAPSDTESSAPASPSPTTDPSAPGPLRAYDSAVPGDISMSPHASPSPTSTPHYGHAPTEHESFSLPSMPPSQNNPPTNAIMTSIRDLNTSALEAIAKLGKDRKEHISYIVSVFRLGVGALETARDRDSSLVVLGLTQDVMASMVASESVHQSSAVVAVFRIGIEALVRENQGKQPVEGNGDGDGDGNMDVATQTLEPREAFRGEDHDMDPV